MMTIKQQKILLELLWLHNQKKNGIRKDILKKDIFSNDNDFFKQIKELETFEYIERVNYEKNNISYCLTANGFALANILAKQNNTDERFRKIAKGIEWWIT